MWTSAAILFATLFVSISAGKFGDSLKQCDSNNRNALNTCLFKIVEDLRPFMPTGIPEINVPVLDPMFIQSVNLVQGEFRSTFSQIQVRGLSKFTTISVTADPDTMVMKLRLSIPELRITGQYKISGRIFVLAVEGTGTFWNILNNVTVDATSNLVLKGNAPNQNLQVANNVLDLNVSKMRMRLNNLFNGDPILGETVNNFLNENSQEVFAEVKPEMAKQVGELVIKVMNDALGALPADKFVSTRTRS
ncbi:protein takeout-like [Daphnia pulicaria]|uniref:protein takeout-like n=1 Tax=Daphnia pulicaria TaxID=35523 RepID=UPI001EEB0BED|nr:protein takeout-like [Daphnia pulicaria]